MLKYTYSGMGHHYSGHHTSRATKLQECHPPPTCRPYMSSLNCRPPLHVASDKTHLPCIGLSEIDSKLYTNFEFCEGKNTNL